jgi:hypothetical protein
MSYQSTEITIGISFHESIAGIGGHKDPIVPDDRARGSATYERHFPYNVLRVAPAGRHLRVERDTCATWTAEFGPVIPGGTGNRRNEFPSLFGLGD